MNNEEVIRVYLYRQQYKPVRESCITVYKKLQESDSVALVYTHISTLSTPPVARADHEPIKRNVKI